MVALIYKYQIAILPIHTFMFFTGSVTMANV